MRSVPRATLFAARAFYDAREIHHVAIPQGLTIICAGKGKSFRGSANPAPLILRHRNPDLSAQNHVHYTLTDYQHTGGSVGK